jgi:hypothetical protein
VLELIADPETNRLDVAAGRIPAQSIVIEESNEMTMVATGTKDKPVGRAEGSVIFQNRISQPVVVPRGTVVMTNDNRRFETSVAVTIPPTSGTSGEFGAQRVAVVATEPGPVGNVASEAITHIEDQILNQRLTVTNDAPIQGGRLNVVSYITEDDRLRLFAALREELGNSVWGQVRGRVDDSESVFVPWDADIVVVQADYDKAVGDEGEEVTLQMKVKLRGTAFSSKYLAEVTPMILDRIVENQHGSYKFQSETLTLGAPQLVDITEGVVSFTLQAEGDLVSTWDLGELRRDLANKTREEAEGHLNSLDGVSGYTLELGPDWYDRMPRLWFRISIEVLEPVVQSA